MIYLHRRIGYWEVQNSLPENTYVTGYTVEEYNKGYYILLNDTQLKFREENPEATPIEVINSKLHEITIDEARENKIIEIRNYYYSDTVNQFYLDDNLIWYSDNERSSIKDKCKRYIDNNISSTNIKYCDLTISNQDPEIIQMMIEDMELYSDKCYDNVQSKYDEVSKLDSIEDINNVDATSGYPDIVHDTTSDIKSRINFNNKNSEELQVVSLMKMQINTMVLTDTQAISVKTLYPEWESFIGKELPSGYRVRYEDRLYNVRMNVNPVLENQPPSVVTASLYEEINETHAGDMYDPIPYNNNMELFEGKYYTQGGVLYKCIRNTGAPVYNTLADMIGIYVELA